jgi:REP element-mobilizing transposase RayT
MHWEIRSWREGAVYHVFNRTARGELRLTPGELVNLFAEGCLARAARTHGVRLIAFIVMGNHFHLIVELTRPNLDKFMADFQRELSHRLNKARGVEGKNFFKRYRCEEIGLPADFEQEVARMLCNPVRARLVGSAEQWPGVSSLQMHRSGKVRRTVRHASRTHAEAMARSGLTPAQERALEPLELELSPPPFWPELDAQQAQARIAELVDAEEARLREEIDANNERVVGPGRIKKERWDKRPGEVHWRAYRRVICGDPEYEAAYHAWYQASRRQYRKAARAWREDGIWGDYPPGTFPPGWLRCLPMSGRTGPPMPWREPQLQAA